MSSVVEDTTVARNRGEIPRYEESNGHASGEPESEGRAVTDAVHERFRHIYVYCEACRQKFIGNGFSIHKHFTKSHPSNDLCYYCPGKVFQYYRVGTDGNNKAKLFYYHTCRDWLTGKEVKS